MSTAAPKQTVPLRACVHCAAPVAEGSPRCPICGLEQRATRTARPPGRVVARDVFVVLAIAGAIVAIVVGYTRGVAPGPKLAIYEDYAIKALIPGGWHGGHVASPGQAYRVRFTDPASQRGTLTIEAYYPSTGTPAARAERQRAAAARRPGYHLDWSGRIEFPDGTRAWELTYESEGVAHAAYFFEDCAPRTVSMLVVLTAAKRAQLTGGLAEQLPSFVQARCSAVAPLHVPL